MILWLNPELSWPTCCKYFFLILYINVHHLTSQLFKINSNQLWFLSHWLDRLSKEKTNSRTVFLTTWLLSINGPADGTGSVVTEGTSTRWWKKLECLDWCPLPCDSVFRWAMPREKVRKMYWACQACVVPAGRPKSMFTSSYICLVKHVLCILWHIYIKVGGYKYPDYKYPQSVQRMIILFRCSVCWSMTRKKTRWQTENSHLMWKKSPINEILQYQIGGLNVWLLWNEASLYMSLFLDQDRHLGTVALCLAQFPNIKEVQGLILGLSRWSGHESMMGSSPTASVSVSRSNNRHISLVRNIFARDCHLSPVHLHWNSTFCKKSVCVRVWCCLARKRQHLLRVPGLTTSFVFSKTPIPTQGSLRDAGGYSSWQQYLPAVPLID